MAFITADRVKDTSTTTGTGNITVSGGAPSGYRTFSTVLSVNDTFYYCVTGQASSEWEVGLGTYLSTNTFARTTVLASSASGSAVSFSSGTKNVFITLPANRTLQFDASQNVGIGTTSPARKLDIEQLSTDFQIRVGDTVGNYYDIGREQANGLLTFYGSQAVASGYVFSTVNGERARIDASGNLLVGTASPQNLEKFNVTGSVANFVSRTINSNASPNGFMVNYTTASPNANSNAMLYCVDSTTLRFAVQSNGGISNYSANNSNLSDQRVKKEIQLSGPYLDKICAIPVKTFFYNDQTDEELNLGVIAQDVDAIAPELVNHDGWQDKDGNPTDYLSIYQTDLQYALMKCIQELSAKNDALEVRLAKLEAK
jgi:hypothetical protein